MVSFLAIFVLLSLLASAASFSRHSPAAMQQRGSALFMKAPSDPLSNLARKFKRKLRSADATSFAELYSTEFEDFLKSKASPGIYNSIYPKLLKRARQLNVTMKPAFGERPKTERPDIAAAAAALGNVESFLRAVTAGGLTDALTGSLCTFFAPSDEAIAKLEPGRWDAILQDNEKLQAVVRHHIVDGSLSSKRIAERNGQALTSLHGADLPVKIGKMDKAVTVGGAKMLQTDIKCKNGVMHVIDSLLTPSA